MNDGYCADETSMQFDALDDHGDETSHAAAMQWLPQSRSTCLRRQALVEWLPRLGPVLWLTARSDAPKREVLLRQPNLLLDHPSIGALTSYRTVRMHQQVSPQGPREWLTFDDESGSHQAKLFLLPDSDCFSWDRMCADLSLEPTASEQREPAGHCRLLRRFVARLGHRGQARLLEFGLRKTPWLSVLDAHPPLRISLLAIDIVRTIARDEHAEWFSPLHQS